MSGFEDQIEWDPAKAAANLHKHGVPFEIAATVFLDPLTRTVPDRAHSVTEERWITMGRAQNGWLLVVIHMWHDLGGGAARIRIISARRATRAESDDYEETHER